MDRGGLLAFGPLVAALVPFCASDAHALQSAPFDSLSIQGHVQERETLAPVPQALVWIRPAGDAEDEEPGAPVAELITGPDGRFTTSPLPRGPYVIQIQALGYQDVEERVRLVGSGHMEVWIQVVPEALTLEPVVVTSVRSAKLDRIGFYERRERGIGYSFTRAEIEAAGIRIASDILRRVPAARVTPASGRLSRFYQIRFRQSDCPPEIFVDGHRVGGRMGRTDVFLDEVILAGDIEGIEIYPGVVSINQYSSSRCGSILVWSLDPELQEGSPFSFVRLAVASGIFLLGVFLF